MESDIIHRCTIFHAKAYRFTKVETGEVIEGISLQYLLTDDFKAKESNNKGEKGAQFFKDSVPIHFNDKLPSVPGVYEVRFKAKKGDNGRPLLRINDLVKTDS